MQRMLTVVRVMGPLNDKGEIERLLGEELRMC
jgi:hypothetical protein